MNRIISFPLCLLLLMQIHFVSATDTPEQGAAPESSLASDLGMAIADISDPFYEPLDTLANRGWWIAEGVLSDLSIDLDGDRQPERLVIYFAPSIGNAEDTPEHELCLPLKDIRLAVFGQRSGTWSKCSDIVIESPLVTAYVNIRVSVWGDGPTYIYIHSSVQPWEAVSTRHAVLSFRDGRLTCDLMLYGNTFSEAPGLFRIDTSDISRLHDVSDLEGVRVGPDLQVSMEPSGELRTTAPHERTDQDDTEPGDSWGDDSAAENGQATHGQFDANELWDADMNVADMAMIFGLSSWDFFEVSEPSDDEGYAAVLSEHLAPFGIDDTRDADPTHCTPVCSVYYAYPWQEGADNQRIIDFTGVRR